MARFFLLMILILANQAYTMNFCCCKPNLVDSAEIVLKSFPTKNIPITLEISDKKSPKNPTHKKSLFSNNIPSFSEKIEKAGGLQAVQIISKESLFVSLKRINVAVSHATEYEEFDKDVILNFNKELELSFLYPSKKERSYIHDINHNLNEMSVGFQILLKDAKNEKAISSLKINLKYLNEMISELYNPLDTPCTPNIYQPIRLSKLLEYLQPSINLLASQHKVKFLYELSDDLKWDVITDFTLDLAIRRILHNLIRNAIIYSEDSKNPEVFLSVKKYTKDYAIFTVKDNGAGMSPDVLDKSFQLNFRGSIKPGSGVGLDSCKKLVESINGEIWATSEGVGLGSTFYFTAPCVPGVRHIDEPTEIIIRKTINILDFRVAIVEDSELNSMALQGMLVDLLGIKNVDIFLNGKDAIEAFKKMPYHLMLVDTDLGGGISGIETTKIIRTLEDGNNVIAASVSGDKLTEVEMKNSGMNASCCKPVNLYSLKKMIKQYFNISV